MAITFEGNQDPYGIQAIGSPIVQALQQRMQQNRQQQQNIAQGGVLHNVISQLGPESGVQDVLKAITGAQQQGVSPEMIKQFEPYLKQLGEQQQKSQVSKQKLNEEQRPIQSALKTVQEQKKLLERGIFGPN